MDTASSFNNYIQKVIVENWNHDALTDYQGVTLQFHDVARKIEKLHILFDNAGIQQGDKIAICGRNSAHWAVAFLATLTYGAVAIPILHEFNAEQIHNIVNHSEAKLLFVGDFIVKTIKADGEDLSYITVSMLDKDGNLMGYSQFKEFLTLNFNYAW